MRRYRNTIASLLIFLVALSTLSSRAQSDNGGDESLIEKTCKRTLHYELCVSTLESNPASSRADLRGLAHMAVEAVLSKATETLEFIRALLKGGEPDPGMEKSLALCAEIYIPVVKYSLPQAIDALIGGHLGFANYGISDAAKQANACKKSVGVESPLAEKNALLSDLSQVAAAIIDVLLKG